MTEGTDEQDLVKALDNVAGAAASVGGVPASNTYGGSVMSPATAGPIASPFPDAPPAPQPTMPPYLAAEPSSLPVPSLPIPEPSAVSTDDAGPLASIKQDALVALRPLVDKLNVSPEEKFDTYLLLIRSTDDTDLIAPAHEAAKAIADETRRAEALLDIIKEIDYLSHPKT